MWINIEDGEGDMCRPEEVFILNVLSLIHNTTTFPFPVLPISFLSSSLSSPIIFRDRLIALLKLRSLRGGAKTPSAAAAAR